MITEKLEQGNCSEDSGEKHTKVVVINGRAVPVEEKVLSFERVVELAFGAPPAGGNTVYTVSFKRGPVTQPEGSLVAGEKVRVKRGMVFNATQTDKS